MGENQRRNFFSRSQDVELRYGLKDQLEVKCLLPACYTLKWFASECAIKVNA